MQRSSQEASSRSDCVRKSATFAQARTSPAAPQGWRHAPSREMISCLGEHAGSILIPRDEASSVCQRRLAIPGSGQHCLQYDCGIVVRFEHEASLLTRQPGRSVSSVSVTLLCSGHEREHAPSPRSCHGAGLNPYGGAKEQDTWARTAHLRAGSRAGGLVTRSARRDAPGCHGTGIVCQQRRCGGLLHPSLFSTRCAWLDSAGAGSAEEFFGRNGHDRRWHAREHNQPCR